MNCTYKLINLTTRSIVDSTETMGVVLLSNDLSQKNNHTMTMLAENEVPVPIQEFVLPITPNSSPISPQNYLQFENQMFCKAQALNDTYSGIVMEEYVTAEDMESIAHSIEETDDTITNAIPSTVEEAQSVNESICEPVVSHHHYPQNKDYEALMRTIVDDVNETDVSETGIDESTSFAAGNDKAIDSIGLRDSDETEEIEKENENDFDNDMDDFEDDDDGDNSSEQELTNLGWLIDLKNLTTWSDNNGTNNRNGTNATVNGNSLMRNINIIDDIDDDDGCLGPIISDRDLSEERFNKFMIQVKQ